MEGEFRFRQDWALEQSHFFRRSTLKCFLPGLLQGQSTQDGRAVGGKGLGQWKVDSPGRFALVMY